MERNSQDEKFVTFKPQFIKTLSQQSVSFN